MLADIANTIIEKQMDTLLSINYSLSRLMDMKIQVFQPEFPIDLMVELML
jgi:hypothetical protein